MVEFRGPRQRGCNADNQKWLAREHICVAAADENHLFIGTAGVPIASLFRVSCLLTTKQSKVWLMPMRSLISESLM